MKNATRLLLLVAVTFLLSCNSKRKEVMSERTVLSDLSKLEYQVKEENIERATEAPPPPPLKSTVVFDEPVVEGEETQSQDQTVSTATKVVKKKIIKDGSISIKTKNIDVCKKSIESLVKKLGGYMDSEYLQNNDEGVTYELKVRIPANNFEAMLSGLESGKDEIKNKNIQARDVTEEYVDIATRLTSKKLYLKRYQELLSRASTIKDILEIEEQIRAIQEEIESKEGRLKYLDDQVAFSSLHIELYMAKAYVYKPQAKDKFTERMKDAFSSGWDGVVGSIVWIFGIWPFILLVVALFIGIKWRRKHIKKSDK